MENFRFQCSQVVPQRVCHLLHTEFPGVFGPAITSLLANKIDELYARFHPPASRFRAGQVLWAAVAVDDPPGRDKRIENTRLVPVILDLVTGQDIDEAMVAGLRSKPAATRSCTCSDRPTHREGSSVKPT